MAFESIPGMSPLWHSIYSGRVPVMAFGLFRACPRYGTRSNSGRVPVMAFGLIPGVSPLWHSIYSGRVPVMAFGLFRACPRHGIRSNSGRAPVMVFSLLTFRVTSHPLYSPKLAFDSIYSEYISSIRILYFVSFTSLCLISLPHLSYCLLPVHKAVRLR